MCIKVKPGLEQRQNRQRQLSLSQSLKIRSICFSLLALQKANWLLLFTFVEKVEYASGDWFIRELSFLKNSVVSCTTPHPLLQLVSLFSLYKHNFFSLCWLSRWFCDSWLWLSQVSSTWIYIFFASSFVSCLFRQESTQICIHKLPKDKKELFLTSQSN